MFTSCSGDKNEQVAMNKDCLQCGGDWRRVCIGQHFQCVMPYKDAGKICADSSECEGGCFVDIDVKCDENNKCTEPANPIPGERATGICKRDNDPCGSFFPVQKGIIQPVIHRD
jgi:hypothetical protein